MIVPLGALEHEVAAGGRADPAVYDSEGYTVGRGVFEPDLIRQLRAPLIESLIADGHIEAVEGEEDRFAWCGDNPSFDIHLGTYRPKLTVDCKEILMASGIASTAIEAMWGRRPVVWGMMRVFVMMPNDPDRVHRDGWQMMGAGGPDEHLNVWVPLTAVGMDDGPLAVAVGSQRIMDQPAEVPVAHPMHLEVLANSGNMPPPEVLAPLWRTTSFEIGDAMAFRPDNAHSTSANTGPYFRIAIGLHAHDARVPLSRKAGTPSDPEHDQVAVEWLTLAVLSVQPSTEWLARQAFLPRGIIGRLWSAQFDDLVGPAFSALENRGLIEVHEIQPGDGVGIHRYFHITDRGRSQVSEWLERPTPDYLLAVKLLFCNWLCLDATHLLTSQPEAADEKSHRAPGSDVASVLVDSTP